MSEQLSPFLRLLKKHVIELLLTLVIALSSFTLMSVIEIKLLSTMNQFKINEVQQWKNKTELQIEDLNLKYYLLELEVKNNKKDV